MLYDLYLQINGQNVHVGSVTANDWAAINAAIANGQQNTSDIAALRTVIAAVNKGQSVLSYKDLSVSSNLTDLEPGVFYRCPCNAAGQFILIDEETGAVAAAADQASGVTDLHVTQFKNYFATSATTVSVLESTDFAADTSIFVTKAGAEELTGTKTFTTAPLLTAVQALATLNDNELVKGAIVKAINSDLAALASRVTANETAIAARLTAVIAAEATYTANVLTFVPSADHINVNSSSSEEEEEQSGGE